MDDTAQKIAFFDTLMAKYCNENLGRPKGFYPQLDRVTVYAIAIERNTGKQTSLPTIEARWPSADHTRTPLAKPSNGTT
ncbi:nitroimidazole resistance protein [Variovorax sp. WS11]|uniref:nitroimidazole resistance protein n=1 Tax=Variovorax sp. WS11 TaxID=1105204 RepID=UPI0011B24FAB|nr:nitroimidazole resistance protein [Variovorax sp. WS11]NDZ19017.1 nitroimidazole resistance protein [Variovorax sp. WS11]